MKEFDPNENEVNRKLNEKIELFQKIAWGCKASLVEKEEDGNVRFECGKIVTVPKKYLLNLELAEKEPEQK